MASWTDFHTKYLETYLLSSRTDFRNFLNVIWVIEYVPDAYILKYQDPDFEITENNAVIYLRYLLERFMRSKELKLGKYPLKLLADLLLASFGFHSDYPVTDYPHIRKRRMAFVRNESIPLKLDNEKSVSRWCSRNEEAAISYLAEAIAKDIALHPTSDSHARYINLALHDLNPRSSYSLYEIYKNSSSQAEPDDVFNDEERITIPQDYARLALPEEKYVLFDPKAYRKNIVTITPLEDIVDAEDIIDAIDEQKSDITSQLKDIFSGDPIYVYCLFRAIVDLPCDPLIKMPDEGLSYPSGSGGPSHSIGQGTIVGDAFPFVKSYVSRTESLLEQYAGRLARIDFRKEIEIKHKMMVEAPYLTFEFWKSDIYIGRAQSLETQARYVYHKYISDFNKEIFDKMIFRGIVYERSSRNYRIDPNQINKPGRKFIIEESLQQTRDWIVFDYISDNGTHAFSVGFRPDILRLAVFTPYRVASIF